MIDLHSHLLPAVDDGSRSVEQSIKVLERMAREGITAVCLTPHLRATRAEAGPPAAHDQAFDALRTQAPPMPQLHRGVRGATGSRIVWSVRAPMAVPGRLMCGRWRAWTTCASRRFTSSPAKAGFGSTAIT